MGSLASVDGASMKACNKIKKVGQNHRESTDGVDLLVLWTWSSFSVLSEDLDKIYLCLRLKYPVNYCKL